MDVKTVQDVAKFAHLALTDEELERYCKDLGDILGYFELLNEAPGCDERGVNPIKVEDVVREISPSRNTTPMSSSRTWTPTTGM